MSEEQGKYPTPPYVTTICTESYERVVADNAELRRQVEELTGKIFDNNMQAGLYQQKLREEITGVENKLTAMYAELSKITGQLADRDARIAEAGEVINGLMTRIKLLMQALIVVAESDIDIVNNSKASKMILKIWDIVGKVQALESEKENEE